MRNGSPSTDEVVHAVELIYAAANDPRRTPELLRVLTALLEGNCTHLFTRDVVTGAVLHSDMGDPAFDDANRRYARDWGPSDPRTRWLASRAPGRVLRCHEQFDEAFVESSQFHRNFMVPHGFRWSLAAKYPVAPGIDAVIAGVRAPGMPPFEEWAVTVLRQLLPHFEQAAAISTRLERQSAAVHAATEMVRVLPTPCLFTDRAGRCLEGNEAFSRAMESMSLRLVTGRVRFSDTQLQARWESALFEAHATAAPATMQFADAGQKPWMVRLIPWLPLGANAESVDQRMILAVFHEKSDENRALAQPGSMASTARLTRAELEVLAGLLKGLPAKAIALRRSASVNTVRSQIVAILEKTGFNSQKELMASFSTSVLPDSVFLSSTNDSPPAESGDRPHRTG